MSNSFMTNNRERVRFGIATTTLRTWAYWIGLALYLFSASDLKGDEVLRDRFLREAPIAWGQVNSFYSKKGYEMKWRSIRSGGIEQDIGSIVIEQASSGFRYQGTSETTLSKAGVSEEVLQHTGGHGVGHERSEDRYAIIYNEDYKANISVDPTPSLSKYTPVRRKDQILKLKIKPSICPTMRFFDAPAKGLLNTSAWRIADAEVTDPAAEEELVRIEFVPAAMDPSQKNATVKASVVFSPIRMWCVTHAAREAISPDGHISRDETIFTFDPQLASSPHPSTQKKTRSIDFPNGTAMQLLDEKCQYTELYKSDISDSDCRLPAYGIPEPTATNFRLIYIASATFVALLCILLRNKATSAKLTST